MEAKSYFKHESAIVDEPSSIGRGTKIWHFSHIMSGAEIGEQCTLGQNVFIAKDVRLGNGCKVQNNVSLFTGVICEDEVFIGPGAVFTNVTNPRSAINRQGDFKQTLVKKGASIGANATIICGITIGEYAFIGAGAVVTRDVPAYALMVGNPARPTGWMSAYGHRLEFDEEGHATCPESGQMYRLSDTFVQPIQA